MAETEGAEKHKEGGEEEVVGGGRGVRERLGVFPSLPDPAAGGRITVSISDTNAVLMSRLIMGA